MEEILRRTWAEIDLDALKHNFQQVRAATSPKAQVCCVVKADAYGHGALRVAQELEALGAGWFALFYPIRPAALPLCRGPGGAGEDSR